MSYHIIKYEFMGQDSAGLRGADRKIQVIKFFEPLGTSRRGIPWVSTVPGTTVLRTELYYCTTVLLYCTTILFE